MSNSIIQAIKDYMETCPLVDEFAQINVDYLSEETDYSIEATSAETIVKNYIDGSSLRQFVFIFSSKKAYGQDVLQNMENSGFYERFSDWVEEQTRKKSLPELPDGKRAVELTTKTHSYIVQTGYDKAQYQIECRLYYMQNEIGV